MSIGLSKNQVEDLLEYCGAEKLQMWKGNKIQFCCPIHGENNPSCGINIDYSPPDKPEEHYQVFHCFSCGAGGSLVQFMLQSLPDEFNNTHEVRRWIKNKYGVDFKYHYDPKTKTIKKYEDFFNEILFVEKRHIIPMSTLAPFKSGKSTYEYFFERGFSKEDVREYMIGRDLENETVTTPVFWEDKKLAGVIGRYIDPSRPKNMRFKIYSFPKGDLLYPLDKVQLNGTLILVESMWDAIMLRKWGFMNVLATMGDGFTRQQANLVINRCRKVITLFDNDSGGDIVRALVNEHLKNKVVIRFPSYYPQEGKDPMSWGELETVKVIKSADHFLRISRI